MTELERRYRRLLAWYPAAYREVYEEEMVGVLLAGARDGQRHPELRETLDLLSSAVRARLGRFRARLGDSRWADAAAVAGVLAAVLLLAKQVRPVARMLVWTARYGGPFDPAPMRWLRIGVWAAVTLTVLCGWRAVAAAGAWVAVLIEVILLVVSPADSGRVLEMAWPLLLAVLAAVALTVAGPLTVAGGARRGTRILGRRGMVLLGMAGVVAAGGPIAEPLLSASCGTGYFCGGIVLRWSMQIAVLTYVTVVALVVAAVAGIVPAVRRRVLALLAPTVTMLSVLQLGFEDSFSGIVYVLPPVLDEPTQWVLLATVPAAVLVAGLIVVRRRERDRPPAPTARRR
jgi:hypothetical protein